MASPETGYVTDQEYTHGYYAELNPLRLRLALLNAGLKPPVIEHASSIPFACSISPYFKCQVIALRTMLL